MAALTSDIVWLVEQDITLAGACRGANTLLNYLAAPAAGSR
ncbi:hypothetical protein GJA_2361 [Janthinobacterium agaricidamnosum NBRC 102515 = DSM 9628]|uniref:Uncharacterized protein n=1 Tax=Janthinobacterium agaricidamnosum NBRC 102515 = DSM 9628 TaxID=1349767 RepID=W0V2F4_9BURK|nr:hypothetical protein GJA_2361 [Janthinobacterium agaricidamnosum NBRC 102515 = DSM 9628]